MSSNNSTGSATDANVSYIAECCVHQLLMFTLWLLHVPIFFLRLFASLEAKYQLLIEKWLPWSRSSRSRSLTFEKLLYFLIAS